MPIYEYECLSCGKQHEIMQRHNDMPLVECPDCGGGLKKLMSNTSFVLKGTGWYKTDYASPAKGGERKDGNEEAGKQKHNETKKDKNKAENKSEASEKS